MATVPMTERLRRCQVSVEARKADISALEARLAAVQDEAAQARARADGEVLRRELADAALEAERAKVASLQAEIRAAGEAERERLSALKTPELELAVGLFPTFFPAWFRAAVMVLVLAALAGCGYPLACSPTWFRSCVSRVQAPVPAPLMVEAPQEFAYSYLWRRGALVVTVPAMPEGRWRVEARRQAPAGEVVLGWMVVTVPPGTSLTEIEVWPSAGRSLGLDVYPVFTEEPHEAAGRPQRGLVLGLYDQKEPPGLRVRLAEAVAPDLGVELGERLQSLAVDLRKTLRQRVTEGLQWRRAVIYEEAAHDLPDARGDVGMALGVPVLLAPKPAKEGVHQSALKGGGWLGKHVVRHGLGLLPGEDAVGPNHLRVRGGVQRSGRLPGVYRSGHLRPASADHVRDAIGPVLPPAQAVPLLPEPLPHPRLGSEERLHVGNLLPEAGLLDPPALGLQRLRFRQVPPGLRRGRVFVDRQGVLHAFVLAPEDVEEPRGPFLWLARRRARIGRELVRLFHRGSAPGRGGERLDRRGCRHVVSLDPLPALHLAPRPLRHPASVVPSLRERGQQPVEDGQAGRPFILGALFLTGQEGFSAAAVFLDRVARSVIRGAIRRSFPALNAPQRGGRLPDNSGHNPRAPVPLVLDTSLDLRLDLLPADPRQPLIQLGVIHLRFDSVRFPLPVVGGDHGFHRGNSAEEKPLGLGRLGWGRNGDPEGIGGNDARAVRLGVAKLQAGRQFRLLRVPPGSRRKRIQCVIRPDVALFNPLQDVPGFAFFHGGHPPAAYCTKNQEGTQAWTG